MEIIFSLNVRSPSFEIAKPVSSPLLRNTESEITAVEPSSKYIALPSSAVLLSKRQSSMIKLPERYIAPPIDDLPFLNTMSWRVTNSEVSILKIRANPEPSM